MQKAEIEVLFTVQFVCVTPTVPYVEYFRAAEAAIAVAALNRVDYRMICLKNGKTVKSGYVLSPKDMALVNDLGTLKRIGVTSLKIEGRLKRAEYVSAVVGVYRKYLDKGGNVSKRYAGTA